MLLGFVLLAGSLVGIASAMAVDNSDIDMSELVVLDQYQVGEYTAVW